MNYLKANKIKINGPVTSTSSSTGALIVTGGVGVDDNLNVNKCVTSKLFKTENAVFQNIYHNLGELYSTPVLDKDYNFI